MEEDQLLHDLSDSDLKLAYFLFVEGLSPSESVSLLNPSTFASSDSWHRAKAHAVGLMNRLRARARLLYPDAAPDDLDRAIRSALLQRGIPVSSDHQRGPYRGED